MRRWNERSRRVAVAVAVAVPSLAAVQAVSAPSASAAVYPTTVAVGFSHACAIVGGHAYCWGNNSAGAVGNTSVGTQSNSAVPVDATVVLAGKTVSQISAGNNFTCALDNAGAAYCWGSNSNGQLGNNSTANSPVPAVVSGSVAYANISVSDLGNHTCAIESNGSGTPWCWGLNGNGQLGNNSTAQSLVPAPVDTTGVLNGKRLTEINAGTSFSCAVADAAYCWGLNSSGQLGNNSTAQSLVPVAVDTTGVLNGKTVAAVAGGDGFGCSLDTAGHAYCWGNNAQGQLGNNSTAQSLVPVAVDTTGVLNGKTLTQISDGVDFACAVDTAGQAYCWGNDNHGQLGNGKASAVPVAVDTTGVLKGVTLTQISAGSTSTCAMDTASNVYCWGQDNNGQLGDGSGGGNQISPVKVVGLPAGGLSISVPGSATLPDVAPGSTTSAQLGTVTVTDSQGAGAWTATVSSTVFTSGSQTIALTQVSYWSGPATATTGTGTFTPGQPAAADAVPLTTSTTAFSLVGGSADNSASWNPTLSVAVPPAAVGGTYTATVTHSVS